METVKDTCVGLETIGLDDVPCCWHAVYEHVRQSGELPISTLDLAPQLRVLQSTGCELSMIMKDIEWDCTDYLQSAGGSVERSRDVFAVHLAIRDFKKPIAGLCLMCVQAGEIGALASPQGCTGHEK